MREHAGEAVGLGVVDGVEGFAEGADLVDLNEDGVGGAFLDAALDELFVGDEEVVADELDLVAEFGVELGPAFPVVFGEAVFDGADGVFVGPVGPDGDEVVGGDDLVG